MVALLLQEPRVHRPSRSARPDRATLRKQPDKGSMRVCSCLGSRMTLTRAPDARRGQNLDVAGMQNIEAPVGESDSQSLFAPIQKMRLEVAARRDNLFFGGE